MQISHKLGSLLSRLAWRSGGLNYAEPEHGGRDDGSLLHFCRPSCGRKLRWACPRFADCCLAEDGKVSRPGSARLLLLSVLESVVAFIV